MSEPRIIVLTAPSGAGKSTIADKVMDKRSNLRFSVSATTRSARPSETDGEHYHFLSEEDFKQRIKKGDLLEYEEVYPGRFYGTLRSEIDNSSQEHPVLLDIDVRGAKSIKKEFREDALAIFIKPPSHQELAARLRGRGTEDDHDLEKRLQRATKELQQADDFDAVVMNDEIDDAVDETLELIDQFLKS